jgi:hypothetical protein
MVKVSKKAKRVNKVGKSASHAKVLGVTKDGVHILKPRGKATHFTQKEIREAVATARAARRA